MSNNSVTSPAERDRKATRPLTAVLLCLLGMTLAACGQSDAPAQTNAPATVAAPADTAPEATAQTEPQQTAAQTKTASAASAQLPTLQLLPESSIAFTAEQIGVPLQGRFRTFSADVQLDPVRTDANALSAATIALTVDTHSITVGVADTDKELTGDAWFGSSAGGQSGQASFTSSLITSPADGVFEITGMLTIKGKSHALTTTATAKPEAPEKWLVTGSFPLQRLAFDIGTSPWDDTSIVADKVDVQYSLLFRLQQPTTTATAQPSEAGEVSRAETP